ncbi:MAG: sigma-54-dependent Fis family transcriptional regulator [Planctomycetes bacterium]|nr:sigma-54-dependent Fis family transcriptional regulator [Planctomycetota bacterium]
MADRRVVLVADDADFMEAAQEHLAQALGQPALAGTYADVAEQLTCDSDGLLLVGVARQADLPLARRLVQQLSLQRWPAMVVLLDALGANSTLAALDPYISRRLRWPDAAERLTTLVRDLDPGRQFRFAYDEGLEEMLSRRLLALTPSLLPLADRIALGASHDVTVLINGETGTGKTYLARFMHDYSPRRQHRFMTISCGAISANLIESEFFGHMKGAFTGADRTKVGKFAAVGEGTLLLDEIDTLALEQQATLLRVIETGEFEPVGSTETQRCEARLIVASNIDLEKAVALGKFRADLYFRLNVMSFHLPPLRERVSDVEPLARGMAVRFARKFAKEIFEIHPDALSALEGFSWPGNLRQLENVIQHAVLMCSGPELLPAHLPDAVQESCAPIFDDEEILGDSLHQQRDHAERGVIQRALVSAGFNRTRAADALGISRVTLYKKMKKYGLLKESARM